MIVSSRALWDSLSAPTLRRMWDDYAARLARQGSASDDDIATLNWLALRYGEALGVCVFLSGRD